jgi:hypothetical protein
MGGATPQINNYLIPAILSTLCCCPPFGIVSIVFAAQVNGKLAAGDVAGARSAADSAKMWFWVSFGLGLAGVLVYFALTAVGLMMGLQQQPQQFR